MRKKVFTIYDNVADLYAEPFVAQNEGSAKRLFAQSVNDSGNNRIAANPADYELVEIGTWSDETGRFVALDDTIRHGTGTKYLEVSQNGGSESKVKSLTG